MYTKIIYIISDSLNDINVCSDICLFINEKMYLYFYTGNSKVKKYVLVYLCALPYRLQD